MWVSEGEWNCWDVRPEPVGDIWPETEKTLDGVSHPSVLQPQHWSHRVPFLVDYQSHLFSFGHKTRMERKWYKGEIFPLSCHSQQRPGRVFLRSAAVFLFRLLLAKTRSPPAWPRGLFSSSPHRLNLTLQSKFSLDILQAESIKSFTQWGIIQKLVITIILGDVRI